MSTQPKFGKFTVAYDKLGTDHPWEPETWYTEMLRRAYQEQNMSKREMGDWTSEAKREIAFMKCGRPYYKIWPGMLAAMQNINIDIDGQYLHSPFPAFELRLPIDNSLEAEPGNPVVAILASIAKPDKTRTLGMGSEVVKAGELSRLISMAYSFKDGQQTRCDIPTRFGSSIKDCLERYGNDMPDEIKGIEASYKTPIALRLALVSVTVATSLFAVDNHELVMPDIKRDEITIKGKRKGAKVARQLQRDRELTKCKGWKVGSEIDLPRPLIHRKGSAETGTGRELEHGHIRSGHMRMQPCGKENKDRKLIFVPPTVVRPDLPIRQTHGYRIKDKLLA